MDLFQPKTRRRQGLDLLTLSHVLRKECARKFAWLKLCSEELNDILTKDACIIMHMSKQEIEESHVPRS
jgi:hypothetical protein